MSHRKRKGKYCPNFKCNRLIKISPFQRWRAGNFPLLSSLAVRRLGKQEWRRYHKCGVGNCEANRCKKENQCYFCINKAICQEPIK